MPIDAWGNRADVIADGDSTFKRMNFGRIYEHWFGATLRQIEQLVRGEIDDVRMEHDMQYLRPEHRARYRELVQLAKTEQGCFNILEEFYCVATPNIFTTIMEVLNSAAKWKEHLEWLRTNQLDIVVPTNSENMGSEVIWELANRFPIPVSPVTYVGASGRQSVTVDPVLIGSVYMILLEKTGEDWAAVASAKRQHYGVLARLTNRDKHSSPWRRQPVRILGEAEVRLLCAVLSPKMVAELLELPNSPKAQRHIAKQLLSVEKPTAITRIVGEEEMPRGQSRPLLFVRHLMECAGCRYTNE